MPRSPSSFQYEPLITPQRWQGDEQRFSIRLTELLDDLHRMQGTLSARLKALETSGPANGLLDVYPVGSLYLSVSDVSPSVLFGGTWERIRDSFLLAAGEAYTAGSTGGEAEHLLGENELPALSGTFRAYDVYNLNNSDAADHITGVFSYDESESYGTATNMSGGKNDTVRKIHLSIGGSQPHNNLPPYLAVYIWKRTA